jgi:hypothetical protein
MCRIPAQDQHCSIGCGEHQEVTVIARHMLNAILQDKKIDALAFGMGAFLADHAVDISDAWQLKKLYQDFGWTGKAYLKTINGKEYIIFKGRPGLRKVFIGTKYSPANSKVLSYGIGKAGLAKSIKGGTIFSLVFVNTWNIAEYFIKHDKTLVDLGVLIASDSVKVVIASAASGIVAGLLLAPGIPIIVPLAAGLVVGMVVGALLDKADEKWQITESLRIWANQTAGEIQAGAGKLDEELRRRVNQISGVIDATRRSFDEFEEWKRWFDSLRLGIPSFR